MEEFIYRELGGGIILHSFFEPGDVLTAEEAPEIVLRIAGHGKIYWPEAPKKDRSGAAILLPEGQSLTMLGKLRALRLALPGIVATPPTAPVAEVLVNILLQRAWRSTAPIAETALVLIRMLIEEELDERAGPNGAGSSHR
ncbi:MAG: hypothetical protein AAGH41_14485 [Pseudomonadota bacterium]